jgi:hypothetical protein
MLSPVRGTTISRLYKYKNKDIAAKAGMLIEQKLKTWGTLGGVSLAHMLPVKLEQSSLASFGIL